MTPRINRIVWRGCIVGTMLLLAITYSPLVLRENVSGPWLFGLPLTLWASLATAFGIVVLTAIGAAFLPDDSAPKKRSVVGSDNK